MTEALFGLLTSSFAWTYGLLSPFAGFLSDRFSRSRVITVSLFLWSVVTWLTGYSSNFHQLLTMRILMGICEACYLPAALALITDHHRGSTRSLAVGVHMSGIFIGCSLAGIGGLGCRRAILGIPLRHRRPDGNGLLRGAGPLWLRDAPEEAAPLAERDRAARLSGVRPGPRQPASLRPIPPDAGILQPLRNCRLDYSRMDADLRAGALSPRPREPPDFLPPAMSMSPIWWARLSAGFWLTVGPDQTSADAFWSRRLRFVWPPRESSSLRARTFCSWPCWGWSSTGWRADVRIRI